MQNEEIRIEKITDKHIDSIVYIEEECFSVPWNKKMIADEICNEHAHYFAAVCENGKACGYCGLWHVVNEGHITKIAVLPEYREMGIGTKLIERMIDFAYEMEMIGLTLEVRMNNEAAHRLYAKTGFKPEGIRKNYYSDTKEDAIIMWNYL